MAKTDAPQLDNALASPRALLREVLLEEATLTREERLLLVEQALTLLELSYVHLPQKRAMYAVDPVQRLRLIKYRLEQSTGSLRPEIFFHNEMIEIFTQVRDLHTNYLLVAPYSDKTAFLPFLIEEFYDENRDSHFIVTKIDSQANLPDSFVPGVEILFWNGVPIRRAVELNGDRQAGSNPDARYQRGLSTLTIRPLLRSLPPDEEWVVLRYSTADGRVHDAKFEWYASRQPPEMSADQQARGTGEALAFGFDIQWSQTQEVRKELYAPPQARHLEARLQELSQSEQRKFIEQDNQAAFASLLPLIFRADEKRTKSGTFGYVRVFSFMHSDADAFVAEFKRLVDLLPQDGLIIDVRGNGGGNILASERLLQVLTTDDIEPARFQFINGPLTLALARRYADLAVWAPSIAQSVETGALESLSFPITTKQSLKNIKQDFQPYPGPVVLITDALCYSATDMFAAGFQDHKIGKVLGTSGNTGAGGANVWTHSDLRALVGRLDPSSPVSGAFKPLPRGAEMRVAIRRCLRVRENAGIPVEDLGIVPDEIHNLTKDDLLKGNVDLLDAAGAMLAKP
jgi:hypothetical protein